MSSGITFSGSTEFTVKVSVLWLAAKIKDVMDFLFLNFREIGFSSEQHSVNSKKSALFNSKPI